jgi:hypothetical protein
VGWDQGLALGLLEGLIGGEGRPEVEIVPSSEINGANGAFAGATGKVYLAQEFVESNGLETISIVLLEELGHFLDWRLNAVDSAGDEGAIFAALVRGQALSGAELAALRGEDDRATVVLDGVEVEIEQMISTFQYGIVANGISNLDAMDEPGFENVRTTQNTNFTANIDITDGYEARFKTYNPSNSNYDPIPFTNVMGTIQLVPNTIITPLSSTVAGVIIHTANPVGPEPWGSFNLFSALNFLDSNAEREGNKDFFFERDYDGTPEIFAKLSNGLGGARVTLTWVGNPTNNLDLTLRDSTGTIVASPNIIGIDNGDVNDTNYEIIRLPTLADGDYSIEVGGTLNATTTQQSFSLFITSEPETGSGHGRGDVHLKTFDGRYYDLQSVGEFILVKSVLDDFQVQTRQEASPNWIGASVNTAFATKVGGLNVVYDTDFQAGSRLSIGGETYDLQDGTFVTIDTDRIERQGNKYTITYAGPDRTLFTDDDDVVTAFAREVGTARNRIDIDVDIADYRTTLVRGLLGNADGRGANDFALRDGTNLNLGLDLNLRRDPAWQTIHTTFADSWRITQQESLFGTPTFADLDFPTQRVSIEGFAQQNPQAVADAFAQARAAGIPEGHFLEGAVLDFLVTGDESFITDAKEFADFVVQDIAGPTQAEIRGQKWDDLDGDGVQDAGEAGLSGWTIYLDSIANGQLDSSEQSTVTDANGNYSFSNLGPGTYTVRYVNQAGRRQTSPANSAANIVNLSAGEVAANINFGSETFTPATVLNLGNLAGNDGFAIEGIKDGDKAGISVSEAGDINGDGIGDVVVGARFADPNGISSGQSYVVFGKNGPFSPSLQLSSLDGTNGFRINGSGFGDWSGAAVSSAGDVNGDGVDDLIIGAPFADVDNSAFDDKGESYVIFGSTTAFSATFELSALNGTNGFKLNGSSIGDFTGGSVSGIGDVNQDGFDDLLIGAQSSDVSGTNSGKSYIVFGANSLPSSLNLSALNGTNGFALNGIASQDLAGASVSEAGDINGDGVPDFVIGAPLAKASGLAVGQTYVIFGRDTGSDPFPANLNLDGTNGFTLNGVALSDNAGWSVGAAGDVNGDGVDDLVIGARFADPNGDKSGQAYVVFGSQTPFSASIDLSSLDGTNGFAINGAAAGDNLGWSVSGAGDFNADGFADILLGAPGADANGTDSGAAYVVYGSDQGFNATLDLATLSADEGTILAGVNPGDEAGWSVSQAGDVNQDGGDDVIIGSPSAQPNGSAPGASYVVFGQHTCNIVQNNAPELTNPIRGQGLTVQPSGTPGVSEFTFAANTFVDPDPGDVITYTAELLTGLTGVTQRFVGGVWDPVVTGWSSATPIDNDLNSGPVVGLSFDPSTRTFQTHSNDGQFHWVRLVASDGCHEDVTYFDFYNRDGRVIDNYIAYANVFLDTNGNGQYDANEPFSTSDGNGDFNFDIFSIVDFDLNQNGSLDPDEASIVAIGGIDTATGLPLETPLRATPNSQIISLLTSLVADLAGQGSTVEEANTLVVNALSIPTGIDINTLDPIEATNNNEPGGVETFSAMVQVQNVVTQITGLIDGASSTAGATIVNNVIGSITSQIQGGTPLNLTDATLLQTLIENSANNTGVNLNHLSTQAAIVIAAANQRIIDAVTNLNSSDLEVAFAKVQKVALGKTTQDLEQAGAGTKEIADVVAENTGNALDNLINSTQVFSADPTDLNLSSTNIPAGQSIGTEIGTFSTVDPDTGETHTYQFVNGEGDTDNDQFEIVGDRLLTKAGFDSNQGNYSIRVLTSDGNGGIYTESFTLTQNQAPAIDSPSSPLTVSENTTTVTTITATDPDNDTLSFSLVESADRNLFTLDTTTGVLTFQSAPNYEAPADSDGDNIYEVGIKVEDGNGSSDTQTLQITVTDVNEAPSGLGLSNNTILESAAIGSTIGQLYNTDPDTSDSHTYTLVSGVGDTGNGNFRIEGNQLLTNAALDYETQTSHSIRIRTQDSGGNISEQSLTINITDVNETVPVGGDGIINGTDSQDYLFGANNDDTINGLAGNDILVGQGGNDLLVGGAGADILVGLAGADHYQYNQLTESTLAASDTIVDFDQSAGDRFDINAVTVNNAFYLGDFSSQTAILDNITTIAAQVVSNEAVLFRYLGRMHLVVDGGNSIYEPDSDLMLQVSQFSFKVGDGTVAGPLVASDYFV